MPDREKVIKGLEILMNGCEYIHCDDCCFYISTKPLRCGLREEQIQEDALALLKEDCHNCKLECLLQKYDELKEKYDAMLKEQEARIKKYDTLI